MRTFAPQGIRFVALLAVAGAAAALGASASQSPRSAQPLRAFVSPQLVAAARAHPQRIFRVILEGTRSERAVVSAVRHEVSGEGVGLGRRLGTISGASAGVTGGQLLSLARTKGIAAITPDRPVQLTGGISSTQQWPTAVDARQTWSSVTNGKLPTPPAIAIVDSGVQANRPDFGNRVIDQTTIVNSGTPNSPGDGYGHGTFVAGLAAGAASGYAGVAPSAPIVSVDVMNDQGMALTSDVIAACDWIVAHKAADNIKVANFSLHSTAPASVFWDPLDRAVEKLWFDGITVVAAAGNYGVNGQPTTVAYAPGNDPFVITVGADDMGGSTSANNDTAAPWSAWGYTYDGFAKPELAAPGRYMVGPVPPNSTLATTRSSSVVAPGYIQLSGTSFAAPIVAGAAAYVLALHPSWTPDQVKGALMLTATPEPSATPGSVGVGLVDSDAAGAVTSPPNPNLALDQFVGPDPNGGSIPVFNAASWGAAANSDASWGAASWGAASWGAASWGAASWGAAAWSSASWGTASWGSASWGASTLAQTLASSDASWGAASWGAAVTADALAGKDTRR
ncbi:MAG TPA: S8 family serine peptidase [Gaiellaceae bacterium]|nr:S8 family serine peptidase [Gaiellaceae bacterium]